ncbi:hypothetical protein [Providencia sp. PROV039]|uniref:hypothetical protein n=1 Tax=Providencia sp. PROV039 TaxID=2949770 RepID=UPI00234A4E74|nr:hypothetical protein [Providencia sp. PROV039]
MNKNQLVLLALNCINENRKPSHTEQSRIYVFYKTAIESMDISVNTFILSLTQIVDTYEISIQKRESIFDFLNVHINNAAIKSENRKRNVK